MSWLVIALLLLAVAITATLRARRFSGTHLVAEITLAGRGVYFSRTADGVWWKLRLRHRGCPPGSAWPPSDDPPNSGVREPRRPWGPGPRAASHELDLR